MLVVVNLDAVPPTVALEDPTDTRRFSVQVTGHGDSAPLAQTLESQGVGHLADPHTAFISVARVRQLAAGRVPDTWEHDFKGMLDYADSKGWLTDHGSMIQAHVEESEASEQPPSGS